MAVIPEMELQFTASTKDVAMIELAQRIKAMVKDGPGHGDEAIPFAEFVNAAASLATEVLLRVDIVEKPPVGRTFGYEVSVGDVESEDDGTEADRLLREARQETDANPPEHPTDSPPEAESPETS